MYPSPFLSTCAHTCANWSEERPDCWNTGRAWAPNRDRGREREGGGGLEVLIFILFYIIIIFTYECIVILSIRAILHVVHDYTRHLIVSHWLGRES